MALKQDIQYCKRIQRTHGKSYFFATRFFPKRLREATHVLYAFFRVPDDFVDTPTPGSDPEQLLTDWLADWKQAYATGTSTHPVLRAAADIHHTYEIPFEESEIFLQAMIQDLTKSRYGNYDELCAYMNGSAAAVGVMMSYVIGFTSKDALVHARDLGYAMQLTNFLRDIAEDIDERDRIYLPLDELHAASVSEADVVNHHFTPEFREFMISQAKRAKALYRSADKGIPMLQQDGQLAVRTASKLYEAILDKLEQQDWNPFLGRARTSKRDKLRLFFDVWKTQKP